MGGGEGGWGGDRMSDMGRKGKGVGEDGEGRAMCLSGVVNVCVCVCVRVDCGGLVRM